MLTEPSLQSTQTENGQRLAIAHHVQEILKLVGEDTGREGLLDTPVRVAKMLEELLEGMNVDAKSVLNTTFTDTTEGPVIVSDIVFYSLCEHHMVPFFGQAHVGYIPSNRIVGLSKIARLVETLSKRLQVQERMTEQIVQAMQEALEPRGVIALVEAEHLCMCARGVKKPGSKTTTLAVRGEYKTDAQLRSEFLKMIGKH
ncbi:GTP cyclohydrolase I FolE [Alicyclobacillus tolerans]|uniref:GTP cyclohydrolase I FolE n=1 Tax=Alicyclobacillus tolerans TaxID=90970 RepID=UPI001F00F633|nr:GTP cyclohydrolase I FolE [Alicyclobacillus tolerans]MCF8566133.1 GTP cyclohydrolase I FolE [Alicyclobacillus tolerans]